jgi:hypothetical protein
MGMYDTIDDIIAYCPGCGKILQRDFQTKHLDCMLDHYKPGDFVPADRKHEWWVEIHTGCEHCSLFVRLQLAIENGKLTDKLV